MNKDDYDLMLNLISWAMNDPLLNDIQTNQLKQLREKITGILNNTTFKLEPIEPTPEELAEIERRLSL